MCAIVLIPSIFNLRSDRSDCKATPNRPLDGVALTFRKFDFFANFTETNLTTDRLFDWDILEVLSALLVEI